MFWTPCSKEYNILYSGPTPLSNTTTESSLAAGTAKKNEQWACNISIYNGTNTTWNSASVVIKNALPTAPNATDQTLYEDHNKTIPLSSTDPDDGDTLTYSKLGSNPSYCTVEDNTGIVTCSPQEEDVGQINTTFIVSDGGTYLAKTNVSYTVIEVNDQPQVTITNTNATEDERYNITIQVTDEEEHYPITFSMKSNNSNLILVNTSENTAYVTFNKNGDAPTYEDRGVWTITINATDAGPSSNTPYDNPLNNNTLTIQVETVNIAPNLTTNLSSISATQGDFLEVIINATDRDLEDNLTFTINSSCSNSPWIIHLLDGSYNASAKINQTITNQHIVCRDVSVTVNDGEEIDRETLTLNLTNTNDAPTVHDTSDYAGNNGGDDIGNLSAIKGILFVYDVNATDPDSETYEGETLTYQDNTTLFNINSGGLISFTPQESHIRNHSILINVSDDQGLWHTNVLSLHITNNTAPTLSNISTITCNEDSICRATVHAYDPDVADTLTFTSNNTVVFNITKVNGSSAQTNFIPLNPQVGSYPITVTVSDQHGTTDTESFTFSINNTNDAPFIDQNQDGVEDNITLPTCVELHTTTFRVNATDEDLDIDLDNLSFSFSFTQDNHQLVDNVTLQEFEDYAVFSFTPLTAQIDNYTINISVSDQAGLTDWEEINFTVHARGSSPEITQVKPHQDENNNTQITWESTAANINLTEIVSFDENTLVHFDAQSTYDVSIPGNSISYYWYYDGTLNTSIAEASAGVNSDFNISFDYFSAGEHNITLLIEDERYAQARWYWNVTLDDVNRVPTLINNLDNITLNTTITNTDYFSYKNTKQHFYDPDDDLNSDGNRSTTLFSETTSLTYSLTEGCNCSAVELTFSGDDLSLTPVEEGTCIVNFTATDPYNESVQSNNVWLIITDVVVEEVEVENPSTGGGGSSSTRTKFVPFPFEVPEQYPSPIDLIVPEEVDTYENQTVEIPIHLENKWNDTLEGIVLTAESSLNHTHHFSNALFESLPVGTNASTTLYVDQYRLDSPYSITVTATVEHPAFNDTAIIMINAMEKKDEGDDIESKVTFARDLLNDNPECQEFNELLNRAEEEGERGNAVQAVKLINTAVQGCKYLVNNQKDTESGQPKAFFTFSEYVNKNLPATLILCSIIIIITFFGVSMIITSKKKMN